MLQKLLLTALIVMCSLSTTRQSHINLARGKPTYQSSQAGNSPNAVDGNRNPNIHAGSCTHTDNEVNPWWGVDLQHRYTLGRVDLTNRGDCCPERLRKVRIGTTDTNPAVKAPSPGNLRLCTSRDSPVGWGVTQPFYSTNPCTGRYLVVLLEGAAHILTVCEVEVFAMKEFMTFLKTANSRLVGHVIASTYVRSKLECAKECNHQQQCGSFNLHVSGSVVQCELNAETPPQQTANDMTADTQWTFHQGTVILVD